MKTPVITTSLTPKQVYNQKGSLMGSKWQNIETEASAWWLLKLAAKRKNWNPFTQEDINKLYNKKYDEEFWFNHLTRDGDIVEIDGKYYFTDYFIIECNRLLNK